MLVGCTIDQNEEAPMAMFKFHSCATPQPLFDAPSGVVKFHHVSKPIWTVEAPSLNSWPGDKHVSESALD